MGLQGLYKKGRKREARKTFFFPNELPLFIAAT
jgi:hypothetical protein